MNTLVIVGAGGFGREVYELVSSLGGPWSVEGFIDDAPSEDDVARVCALRSELTGTVASLADRGGAFSAVLAVGSPQTRCTISRHLAHCPVNYPSLVHPDATVGSTVSFAEGDIVAAGARLSTNITVGRHVHIDQNATVGHDCVLGDFSRLNPQACISGSVRVGSGTTIGASATVLRGLSIGDGATVGAGAVVTHDVPAGAVVRGMPAR